LNEERDAYGELSEARKVAVSVEIRKNRVRLEMLKKGYHERLGTVVSEMRSDRMFVQSEEMDKVEQEAQKWEARTKQLRKKI